MNYTILLILLVFSALQPSRTQITQRPHKLFPCVQSLFDLLTQKVPVHNFGLSSYTPEVNPPSSQALHLLTALFSVVINLNGEHREPTGHIVLGQTEHFRWAVPPFHTKVVTKSFKDRECCLESLPVVPNSRLMRYINTWVKCPFTVLYHSVSSSLYSLLGI